jgi:hypothetical protein
MFNLCGLFSGFPIAEKPLSTPEVETERPRDGIRESRGNELTTKLRVRGRMVFWGGKGRNAERNYKERERRMTVKNQHEKGGGETRT